MNSMHKKVLNEILKQNNTDSVSAGAASVVEKDKRLRQEIAELYALLQNLQDPAAAINLLSDHVAMMVNMINEFKGQMK